MTGGSTRPAEHLACLQGLSHVVGWRGVEMAVRDGDGAEPRFGGDGVPCLVFWGLLAILDDGTARRVDTDQDDDAWGLCFSVDGPRRWKVREDGSGYRTREVTELPIGEITVLTVRFDTGRLLVAEVLLRIGGHDGLLMAGEPYEGQNGQLVWHRLDESVLVFTDPAGADDVSWIPERGEV